MRRAAALKAFGHVLFALTWFKASFELENLHPVEGGIFRLKFRRDRRPTMPTEPVCREHQPETGGAKWCGCRHPDACLFRLELPQADQRRLRLQL